MTTVRKQKRHFKIELRCHMHSSATLSRSLCAVRAKYLINAL